MSELNGLVAVVTGANRGIGLGIARLLSERGATVAAMARSREAADETASALGKGAKGFTLDVTDRESVDRAVKEVTEAFGRIDVLVNNAGITRDNLAIRMKDADWDAVLATNLTGVFHLVKAVLRPMMKARSGSIVNISSVVGQAGNPGQANYCAAKAGLEGMTRSLALEYAERNIRINCVAPGFIATDMTHVLDEEQKRSLLGRVPLARLGTAEDVAEAVSFLASGRSSYITGQVLHVNGGMYLG